MHTGGGPCTLCAADGPGGDWVVVFTLTYYAYYANQRTPDSRGAATADTSRGPVRAVHTGEAIELEIAHSNSSI